MRIVIEWDLCIGSGQCLDPAPGALSLVSFQGQQRAVLRSGAVRDEALVAAARVCPTMAIRLLGDDGAPVYPPPEVEAR